MKRVLVIDDCEEFSAVVCDFLTEAGYEVAAAQTENEALDLCGKGGFDVILCDLVLPCCDDMPPEDQSDSAMVGAHLMQILSQTLPQVPIVAISGHLTGNALQGMSQFGAVKALSKPFTQGDLLAAVEAAIKEGSAAEAR